MELDDPHTGFGYFSKAEKDQFFRFLKNEGFKRVSRSKSESGGMNFNMPHVYEKELGDRILVLQLWAGGKSRVSHSHAAYTGTKRDVMNTTPTEFISVNGMRDAISLESTRMDGIADTIRKMAKEKAHAHQRLR